ncbi:MAG TPA: GGDEF domain-containing protein [Verrucomicrobiae bacterium]|nr:GGDEF domain-containing protein [Verrucomicrobiae bacterium]
MTPQQRQFVHAVASIAAFACAATLVCALPWLLHHRWSISAIQVTMCGIVVIAIVALNGLPIRGLRIRRGDFSAEALFQDAVIAIPLFALVGAEPAAIAEIAGFTIAAGVQRPSGRLDLLRQGAVRTLLILALAPFRTSLLTLALAPSAQGAAWFFGLGIFASLAIVFFVSVPFVALRTGLAMTTIWQRLARDRKLWGGLAITVFWSYVIVRLVPDAVPAAILCMWLPVTLYAWLMHRLDDQAVELHRLRLVRDAVQAMLSARDPVPQINAILSSIHGALLDGSVAIVAASTQPVDEWRTIASLGPAPNTSDLELRRRILTRLKFGGSPSVMLRGEYAVMHAFGIRLSDESDLLGALLVRRRHDPIASGDQRQYVDAARDIAPLLRDMRSIAAAQSAATTDALTGLKNRAAILERLRAMLDDVMRGGAVLLLDLDHFKRVNDELGHAAGDECLRRVSEIALAAVRAGDVVGRIGGEEFLIVMPGAGSDASLMVGERLRLAISLSGLRHGDGSPITASLGAATAAIGDTAETLLERADRALYEAKRTGRNRIVEGHAETA